MCQKEVEKVLQQSGKRMTEQRRILLNVILNGQWESCKEIYYEVRKQDPSIGIATVYRMMATLEEICVLERRSVYCIKDQMKQ